MKTALLILFLVGITSLKAQTYQWTKSFGGMFGEQGNSITTDASGNVYSTGWFTETVDFDPGPAIFNLTSTGAQDAYVQKLDASGNFLWARTFGGTGYEFTYGIEVDGSGNVYITGTFDGMVDFDPGAGVTNLTQTVGHQVFVQKLNASGNFLWARCFGGTQGLSIALDASGAIYTTGHFYETVDFDPGPGITNLTSVGNTNADVFIHKMDASGNLVWVKSIGGTGSDLGQSIALDASGNVYTTGIFLNTADFNPGVGTMNLTSVGDYDVFVQKMDGSGNFLWAKSVGGTGNDNGYAISVDPSGNVFTAGSFEANADFDPGSGVSNLICAGVSDVFVQKLDASGNFLWAKSMGGNNYDRTYSMDTDASGNVYTIGTYSSTADFDPGPGTANLTSQNALELFMQKMDASGNYVWVKSIGSSSAVAIGNDIAADASDNIYMTGWFKGLADFDPGLGIAHLTSYGGSDIFVQKLKQCSSSEGVDVIITCDPVTWMDGNTYTTSNNSATHVLINALGCDSIVTLKLTINSNTGTDVITACDSYTWIDGNTYTTSNNAATHVLTNTAGCDSVVTLNLTIGTNSGVDEITSCGPYRWMNGITYTSSTNTVTHTLTNAAGCDSVVTLNLTVNPIPDVTTNLNGITVSANNGNAAYQWLDCSTNYAVIPGATTQYFTAAVNGAYAVEITENGCVDTSACVEIRTVGLTEADFGSKMTIFPNPTDGNFAIDLGSVYDHAEISITELTGKVIYNLSAVQTQVVSISVNEPAGLYFVRVHSGEKEAVFKLMKE